MLFCTAGTHCLVLTLGITFWPIIIGLSQPPFTLQRIMSDWLQETIGMDRGNMWLVKHPRMGWGCLKVYVCQKPAQQDSCG